MSGAAIIGSILALPTGLNAFANTAEEGAAGAPSSISALLESFDELSLIGAPAESDHGVFEDDFSDGDPGNGSASDNAGVAEDDDVVGPGDGGDTVAGPGGSSDSGDDGDSNDGDSEVAEEPDAESGDGDEAEDADESEDTNLLAPTNLAFTPLTDGTVTAGDLTTTKRAGIEGPGGTCITDGPTLAAMGVLDSHGFVTTSAGASNVCWTVTVTNSGTTSQNVTINDSFGGDQVANRGISGNVTSDCPGQVAPPPECVAYENNWTCAFSPLRAGATATMTVLGTVRPGTANSNAYGDPGFDWCYDNADLGTNAFGQQVPNYVCGNDSFLINLANVNGSTVGSWMGVGRTPSTPQPPWNQPAPDPTPPVTCPALSADLQANKSVTPAGPVPVNSTITWDISATNNGPDDASGVVLTDTLPSYLTDISAPGCTVSGQTVTCPSSGTLYVASGATTPTYSITATITEAAHGSNLTNTVDVASQTPDPNPDNNTASVVTPVRPATDLEARKSVSTGGPLQVGDPISWNISAFNYGPDPALDVVLTDTLPAGLENITVDPRCSLSGLTVRCPASGSLTLAENQGTDEYTISATVGADAEGQELTNTVVADTSTLETDYSNNTASVTTPVRPYADLIANKTVSSPGPLQVGDPISWDISAHNDGPDPADGVVLTDTLPSGVTDISAPGCSVSGLTVTCPETGSLSVDVGADTPTYTITATVTAAAQNSTLTNSVHVGSTTLDPNLSNNDATTDTTVGPSADVRASKTLNPNTRPPLQVGDSIWWTITATNDGPGAAQNVVLTDVVPASVTNVSAPQCSVGTPTAAGTPVTCPAPGQPVTLLNGASVSFVISGTVTPAAEGQEIVNSVTVGSDTHDPNPGNNEDQEITPVRPYADLTAIKTVDPATPNPLQVGDTIIWHISATNAGPDPATDVVLTDTLPAGVTNVSAPDCALTGATLRCPALASLTVGVGASTPVYTITATVAPAAAGTSLTNTVVATTSTLDGDDSNNTASVTTPVPGETPTPTPPSPTPTKPTPARPKPPTSPRPPHHQPPATAAPGTPVPPGTFHPVTGPALAGAVAATVSLVGLVIARRKRA